MDSVKYKGIEYPIRYACIKIDGEEENVPVSIEELDFALCNICKDGSWEYKDDIARQIDEGIYCYVEPHIINDMEQNEFERYIQNNFC